MLIIVTTMLMIVTIIPTIPRTISNIISCTFRIFSIMYHLRIQEVLKMYSSWQKVNRLPFRAAPVKIIII